MILNFNVIVFEEMLKLFEYIKWMESLIKEEIDWLLKYVNDYDSDIYKIYMFCYEFLLN